MDEKDLALEAIRKKLVGKKLTYHEIYAIMDQIAEDKLGDILTTYFVASGYSKGFSNEEIYFLTRAMVATGEKLQFTGIVADKHSIGGTPGGRTTMIVVPIVAAAGFKIPKSSSRAITTPSGTADAMEVLAKVTFSLEEIYGIVAKTNGCIVWGGSFKIAPADDEIIRVEEPLVFESYDKVLVSVMAKKVAFGATHVVVELPFGKTAKLHRVEDAHVLARKFMYLANKFHIKLKTVIRRIEEPAGFGIGPLLEARDALQVLEQANTRPEALERRSLELASVLLDLCLTDAPRAIQNEFNKNYRNTAEWATHILQSGEAHKKMMEIIAAQRGNPRIVSSHLAPAKIEVDIKTRAEGIIHRVNSKNITLHAKLLGAPEDKKAGIFLHKRLGERVKKGDVVFTLYSESKYRAKEVVDSLDLFPIFEVE